MRHKDEKNNRDFPAGPVATNAGAPGLIPGQGIRSYMPQGQKTNVKIEIIL